MKIMVVNGGFYSYGAALSSAFREMGHTVDLHILSYNRFYAALRRIHFKYYSIKNRLLNRGDLLYPYIDFLKKKGSEDFYSHYQQFSPDVVVFFGAYMITSEVLQHISAKKICWMYDSIYRMPHLYNTLELFNSIFVFEKTDLAFFEKRNLRAKFLPLCADARYFYPVDNNKTVDVSFVGNLSYERVRVLIEMAEKHPEYNIVVFGKVPICAQLGLQKRGVRYKNIFKNRLIDFKEANQLYSRSKVCLNMHHKQSKYGGNMRLFEILCSGAFELVDRNDFIEDEFSNCLAMYSSVPEMYEKLEYYIKNEVERNRIRKNGYEKIVNGHLFKHRASVIMDAIVE